MCALLGGGGGVVEEGLVCFLTRARRSTERGRWSLALQALYSASADAETDGVDGDVLFIGFFLGGGVYGKKRRPSYLTCPCGASAARGKRTVTH